MNFQIPIFLSALIPGIIWIIIIWMTVPHRSTSFGKFFQYFLFGMISIDGVIYFNRIFPEFYYIPLNSDLNVIKMTFLRIAPLEEIMKSISFLIPTFILSRKEHPSTYLAYGAISGLGFAVLENVDYGILYGYDIALFRSITSSVLHVGTGIIFAWFYSIGSIRSNWSRNRTDLLFRKFPTFKIVAHCLIGLFCCIMTHGYYNYLIIYDQPYGDVIFLLFIIIVSTWTMSRNSQNL